MQRTQDWGLDVNLRAAEDYDITGTELATMNVTAGTVTTDVVTFTPATPIEVLAIGLELSVSLAADATVDVPARASRERHRLSWLVSTLDTFGNGERAGDYWSVVHYVTANEAWEDETNGTGGVSPGELYDYWAIMDPGLDQPEAPLVVQENETIRVHRQIGEPGIAADEELFQNVRIHIWHEEAPTGETEVRERFPSSGGAI